MAAHQYLAANLWERSRPPNRNLLAWLILALEATLLGLGAVYQEQDRLASIHTTDHAGDED
jgi:hypothetical protein